MNNALITQLVNEVIRYNAALIPAARSFDS